jgi:hypothetical protein
MSNAIALQAGFLIPYPLLVLCPSAYFRTFSVRVTTILDDTIVGTIFSYDPLTSTLALQHSVQDFRILKVSFLKDVVALSSKKAASQPSDQPFTNAEPRVGPVNLAAIQARERDVHRQESAGLERRGVGVSKEAQEIFDALSRT